MARASALVFSLICTMLGLALSGSSAVALARVSGEPSLNSGRFLLGAGVIPLGVILVLLGGAAFWLALQARVTGLARAVVLPPVWVSAPVFLGLVGTGWALLRAGRWGVFLVVATLAALAPPLLAGRLGLPVAAARPSWRRIVPAFAWGFIVTPLLALLLEFLAVIATIGAAFAGIALRGAGTLEVIQLTIDRLQGRTLSDAQTQALLQLAVRQPVVLAGTGLVLVLAGPIVEELCKVLGVVFFSRARGGARADAPRDSLLTITLMGLASGLGFATWENIFYAAVAGPDGWAAQSLVRGATPLLHGTASAIFALGWARQVREGRGWALARGAFGSIALHSLWNLCAGLILVAALTASGPAQALASLAVVFLLASVLLLVAGCVAVLVHFRRALVQEDALVGTLAPAAPSSAAPATPPVPAPVLQGD